MNHPHLSIILPCYNEGATLAGLVDGYRKVFAKTAGVELVLVDNGSTDDTAERLLAEQKKENPFLLTIATVAVNQGYGHGILTGLKAAGGEFLAWSHADMQCSPEDVLTLYRAVMERPGPKRCFGKGFRLNKAVRKISLTYAQKILTRLVLGRGLEEMNAQPKLFHRSFLSALTMPPKGFELDLYACYKAARLKMDFVTIPVYFHDRQAGQSKWAYSLTSKARFIIQNLVYLLKLRFVID